MMLKQLKMVALALAVAFAFIVVPVASMAQQQPVFVTLPTTYWLLAGSGTITITSTANITLEYVASNTPPVPGTANTSVSLTANVPFNLTSATLIWIQGAVANTQVSVSATNPGGLTPSQTFNGIAITAAQGAPGAANSPWPVATSAYPVAATPITGNSSGTTGAVVGTLAGAAAKTTYICGFDVSAIGGTAAIGPITVAGTVGGSLVYQMSSSAAGLTLSRSFNPCVPASAVATAITITTTADGTASAVDVNSWGYQQ